MQILKSILNHIPFTEYALIILIHSATFLAFSIYLSMTDFLIGLVWSVIVWISFDISFHRMWSHGALKCSKIMEWIFSCINVFSGLRSAIDFSAPHIWHHQYADTEKDTAWPTGMPIWKILTQHKGIYKNINKTEMLKGCRHLLNNSTIRFFHNYFYTIFFSIHAGLIIYNPLLIMPILSMPILFAYMMTIPGGALLQHSSWGEKINNDNSINNKFLSFISLGLLCQHGNHHKNPMNYKFSDDDSFDLIGLIIEKLAKYNVLILPSK